MNFYGDSYGGPRDRKEATPQLHFTMLSEGENQLFSYEKLALSDSAGSILGATHPQGFLASCRDELYAAGREQAGRPGLLAFQGREIFCEYLGGPSRMLICGGGHVSQPLIRLAKMTGFYVTVLEDRKEFAQRAEWAGADEVICEPFKTALGRFPFSGDLYGIVVTRGHQYDKECLEAMLGKKYAYLGVMGSRKRAKRLLEELGDAGFPKEGLEGIHIPVGIPIGAETPEEIAVSILAEVIAVKNAEGFSAILTGEILTGLSYPGPKVVGVIVKKTGSAPRKSGTRMVVCGDGSQFGTVGGGLLEARMKEAALEMLRGVKDPAGGGFLEELFPARRVVVSMTGEEAGSEGLVCGGTMEVWLELHDIRPF